MEVGYRVAAEGGFDLGRGWLVLKLARLVSDAKSQPYEATWPLKPLAFWFQ